MQRLASVMRRVVTSVLVIWLASLAAPCAAQEHGGLDAPVPAAPDAGNGRGPVFVPGGFLAFITPVRDRVALNLYGFYYGEVAVPVAQVDVPVRISKFLTITPSYLYYEVPPSGLEKATAYPARFADTLEENQFRVDGTLKFSIHAFEISDRNMYVRRLRPTDEINRYRHRIAIAHPLAVNGRIWKPFVSYEAFYERTNGGWNRDRVMAGATVPLVKHVAFQPSYIWDNYRNRGLRDVNYLQFGVIVNTK
jgi:hypothetical protein